jgi:diaminopimelate decarboxylase
VSAARHSSAARFAVIEGQLGVGGIALSLLAARVGATPFYAYDRALLTQRVQALRAALPGSISLHYAMKANPMPALVGHMAALVDGIDVASGAELLVALDAGMDAREISFAGPGKSGPS